MKLDAIKAVLTQHRRGEDGVITPDMLEAAWAEYESAIDPLDDEHTDGDTFAREVAELDTDVGLLMLRLQRAQQAEALLRRERDEDGIRIREALDWHREALTALEQEQKDRRHVESLLDEKREECAQLRRALKVKEEYGGTYCLYCVVDPDHKGPCRLPATSAS